MSATSSSGSSERLRIVVTGLIAQHPRLGGITWHYLQYLLGLARLGHEVYYVEDSGEDPYSHDGGETGRDWIARDCSANVAHLADTLSRFGFERRWAYNCPLESRWFGLPDQERRALLRNADLLINVSGSLVHPEQFRKIARLAYVDTDPVVTHVKIADQPAFRRRVEAHDIHFSFGEAIGEAVPATPQRWRATRQPIVLSEWEPVVSSTGDAYTTVMSWTSYEPLHHGGHSYGQKDVEFRRFLRLPEAVAPRTLEVALGGIRHRIWESDEPNVAASGDEDPAVLVAQAGWRVVDADQACGDLDRYRQYIRSSRAEWSVAKNAYVQGQPGWFSERSACYLASGRPVVVQDTGFGAVLPIGEGIVPFRDLEGAVAAIASVEQDYSGHCEAARAIAESHFDSDKVLSRLVTQAMGDE